MSLWQYNAWCQAYESRMRDDLAIQVQAAWLGAYWNSATKHKKSLKTILKSLASDDTKSSDKRTRIDVEKTKEIFRQFEELQKYGRTQN